MQNYTTVWILRQGGTGSASSIHRQSHRFANTSCEGVTVTPHSNLNFSTFQLFNLIAAWLADSGESEKRWRESAAAGADKGISGRKQRICREK